jgi:DNA repair protein RadA/Sms
MTVKSKSKGPRTVYRCSGCGHVESRWLGRCPACQEFSTLIEEVTAGAPPRPGAALVADGAAPIAVTDVAEFDARDRVSTGPRRARSRARRRAGARRGGAARR